MHSCLLIPVDLLFGAIEDCGIQNLLDLVFLFLPVLALPFTERPYVANVKFSLNEGQSTELNSQCTVYCIFRDSKSPSVLIQ